jgi:hypothetical protein
MGALVLSGMSVLAYSHRLISRSLIHAGVAYLLRRQRVKPELAGAGDGHTQDARARASPGFGNEACSVYVSGPTDHMCSLIMLKNLRKATILVYAYVVGRTRCRQTRQDIMRA